MYKRKIKLNKLKDGHDMTKKHLILFSVFLAGFMAYSFVTAKTHTCRMHGNYSGVRMEYLKDGFNLTMTGENAMQRDAIKDVLSEKAKFYRTKYPSSVVEIKETGNSILLTVKGISGAAQNLPMCPFNHKTGSAEEKSKDFNNGKNITL